MKKFLHISLVAILSMIATISYADAYKTLTFSKDVNEKEISTYTDTWKVTIGSDVWTLVNFNNNKNGWNYVKCGNKNDVSISTIATNFAIDKAISSVIVTIDAVTMTNVNGIQLVVASDKDFKNVVETINAEKIEKGALTLSTETATANCYYKLVFDCKKGSSNGIISVSKVQYLEAGQTVKNSALLAFSKQTSTVEKGGNYTSPTFSKATTATVTFTSDNTAVATVDEKGEVTLVGGIGVAVITATSPENDEYLAGEAKYTVTVNEPAAPVEKQEEVKAPYEETFASSIGNFTINDVTLGEGLTYVWKYESANKYMKASAYNSKNIEAESWIVSPIIDLTSTQKSTLKFKQCINKYFGDVTKEATLWIKENGGNWEQLTITYPTISSGSWSKLELQTVDISKYDGKKIVVGFKYVSSASAAGTWEVNNFSVASADDSSVNAVETKDDVNAPIYNIAGQKVDAGYKGIVIKNGKKTVQ